MIQSTIVLAHVGGEGAAAPTSPFGLVVVGFLFVIVVLALLAAATAAMGAWFTKQAAHEAARAAEASLRVAKAAGESTPALVPAPAVAAVPAPDPVPATDASESTSDEEDPALLAVVAAAVHTVIGDRPHRIVSVRSTGPGWAQEGRRQIFSSHRVR